MFRASGAKVWHCGDEEPQVIFLGSTARDIVYLWRDGSEWAVGQRPSGDPIFSGELNDVVDWVMHNYEQYRRALA